MASNYRRDGDVMNFLAPSGGVVSGVGYLIGDTFGVASVTAAAGVSFVLMVEGVFDLPKLSTDVMAQGVKVYWDDTNKRVTVTATSNRLIGTIGLAAGSGVAIARVRLIEGPAV